MTVKSFRAGGAQARHCPDVPEMSQHLGAEPLSKHMGAGAVESCFLDSWGGGGKTLVEHRSPALKVTSPCLSLLQRVRDGKCAVQAPGEAFSAWHPGLCPQHLG